LKYRNIRVCPEQYESLAKSVQGVVNAGLTVRNDNLVLFYEGESNLENQIIESVNKYVNEFAFLKIVKHIEKLPTNHLGKISRKEMDDL
jgi:acyl-coenzyme A synthetase/AMP-(fatty) acid ligase